MGNRNATDQTQTHSSMQTAKKARLEARLTVEQKALIERAAAYEGRTVSEFVVQSAQQAAKTVIQEHEVIQLSRSQTDAFVELLLHPPKPNKALRKALRDYRRNVVSQ